MVDQEQLAEITQRLQRGLRVAVVTIAAVILVLPLSFTRNLDQYQPLWPQLVAYGVLSGVVVAEIILIVLRRAWSRLRWAAVTLVLAVDLLSRWALPAGATVTSADWIFGALGWMGVILLLDRPLRYLAAFLAVHEMVTFVAIVLPGAATRDVLLNFVAGSLGTIGYPLASGIAALVLRGVARTAARAAHEAEESRTAEEIGIRVHQNRQERFAALNGSAGPLLQGLADRTLDPADNKVQRACAIEAARMRRLFAETDTVDEPIVHQLRHAADIATRRGVVVDLEPKGTWPDPPLSVRRALTDAVLPAVTTAQSWARIGVVCIDGILSVNAVADCGIIEPIPAADPAVEVTAVSDKNTTWVEARWATG